MTSSTFPSTLTTWSAPSADFPWPGARGGSPSARPICDCGAPKFQGHRYCLVCGNAHQQEVEVAA